MKKRTRQESSQRLLGQVVHIIDHLLISGFPRHQRLVLFRARAFAFFVVYGLLQSVFIAFLIWSEVGFHPMISTSLVLGMINLIFILLMKFTVQIDRLALAFTMLETFAICATQVFMGGSAVSPTFIFLPLFLPFAFLVCGRRLGWVAAIWVIMCSSLAFFALHPRGLMPPFQLTFDQYLARLESTVFFVSFNTALILATVVYLQFRSEQSLIEEKKRTEKVKKLNELSEFAHSILSLIESPARTLQASFSHLKEMQGRGIDVPDLEKTINRMHLQIQTVAKVAHSYSIFLHPFEKQERSIMDVNKIIEYVQLICSPHLASGPSMLSAELPAEEWTIVGYMNKLVLVLVGLVQELHLDRQDQDPDHVRISVFHQGTFLRFQIATASRQDSRPHISKNYIAELVQENHASLTSWSMKEQKGFDLDVPLTEHR